MWARMQQWLSPEIDLEQAADPRAIIRSGLALIVLVIGGGLAWMALAPLAGAVVSNGVVRTEQTRQPIQHAGGGTIASVLVRDGEPVVAGQVLIEMHDANVRAQYDTYQLALFAEAVRQARLRAEQLFEPRLVFAAHLLAQASNPRFAEILSQEQKLFRVRRHLLDAQMNGASATGALARREIAVREDGVAAQSQSVRLAQQQLEYHRQLAASGFISKTRLMELERLAEDYQAAAKEQQSDALLAEQRVIEASQRREQLRYNYLQMASTELKDSQLRGQELEKQFQPVEDAYRRLRVVAGEAGRIMNVRVRPGMVVGAGAALMELLPSRSRLLIESGVAPGSIRHIRLGQRVDVSLTAYNHRTTPRIAGTVVYVAPDSVGSERVPSVFPVKVELEADALRAARITDLQPGMEAVLYFRTDSRTVLDYLLEPLVDSMRAAFREP